MTSYNEIFIGKHTLCSMAVAKKVFQFVAANLSVRSRALLSYTSRAIGSYAARDVSIGEDGKKLKVLWSDGEESRFHATWLRHNCRCPKCYDRSAEQPTVGLKELSGQPMVEYAVANGDRVDVHWKYGEKEEEHKGFFGVEWLRQNCYSTINTLEKKRQRSTPLLPSSRELPVVTYADIQQDKKGLWNWLRNLNDHGRCLLSGVPAREGELKKLVEKFAFVQPTLYGEMFEVKTTEKPVNLAYGDSELNLHMDLPMYESGPGLQLLHCIRFDECVEGGVSVLVDSFEVCEALRQKHPNHFATLTRVPHTSFRIHSKNHEQTAMYTYSRRHIELDESGEVTAIFWNPAILGPLCVSEDDVEPYYEAFRCFWKMLMESPSKVQHRLLPGEVLTFNNRRALHARTSFERNGGVRHLAGCYVNIDDFKSAVQVLGEKFDKNYQVKRVFNQCSF